MIPATGSACASGRWRSSHGTPVRFPRIPACLPADRAIRFLSRRTRGGPESRCLEWPPRSQSGLPSSPSRSPRPRPPPRQPPDPGTRRHRKLSRPRR
jgi:hypothetical protein